MSDRRANAIIIAVLSFFGTFFVLTIIETTGRNRSLKQWCVEHYQLDEGK